MPGTIRARAFQGLIVLAVILSTCLLVCADQTVDGQIFVRADDGTTVKLSLTDVYAVSSESASNLLNQLQQLRDGELARLTPVLQKAEEELKKFEKLRPELVQQERLLNERHEAVSLELQLTSEIMEYFPNLQDGPNATATREKNRKEIDARMRQNEAKVAKLGKQIHLSEDQIKKIWAAGQELERQLPPLKHAHEKAGNLSNYASQVVGSITPTAKTTTDAEGKFSLAAANNSVVFAFTSRIVNGESQPTCWLVRPVPNQPLLLTNRNTVDSMAAENFALQSKSDSIP